MFTGFSDATADMFWDIRFNNDREWFHTQKARFDQTVMQPVKALSGDLFDWFSTQYPQLHLNLRAFTATRAACSGADRSRITSGFRSRMRSRAMPKRRASGLRSAARAMPTGSATG